MALLHDARKVLEHMDGFKARAKSLAAGLEPELAIVVLGRANRIRINAFETIDARMQMRAVFRKSDPQDPPAAGFLTAPGQWT